ncbi:MAG TPA: M48 family metallopeptidase [Vicinamibacterales bacterium]
MNLLEQQAANRHRTWAVMIVFVAFLVFLGAGFDLFIIGGGGSYVPLGTTVALLVGFGSSWASMRLGDRMVLASASAEPLEQAMANATTDDEKLRYRQFDDVVEEMAIAAGLPKPAMYIVPDRDPTAFATGRDPQHASLAVTEGLLQTLDREELQGVVAHEMSHIRNFDIRLMMIVAALVGAVALMADWAGRGMWFGGARGRSRRDDDRGGGGAAGAIFFVLWIVAIILAPIVGRLLAMWVSRTREYQADATGAELTRNPLGLASALEKIEDAVEPTTAIKRGTAHLCIADPMGKLADGEGLAGLWATHPPMAKRIEALKQMAYQAGLKTGPSAS